MLIEVTEAMIDAGRTDAGGWRRRQVLILGVKWPLEKGWKQILVGQTRTETDIMLFAALRSSANDCLFLEWRRSHKQEHTSRGMTKARTRKIKKKVPQPPTGKMTYSKYLRSKWWLMKRQQKIESTNGKCERCGRMAKQVHHKHYRSLGREKHKDLESLCGLCHQKEHEELIAAKAALSSTVQ